MGTASRYWRLIRLDASGKRKVVEIETAKAFFQQQFPELSDQKDVSDTAIQRQLLERLRDSTVASRSDLTQRMANQCLRCLISSQIEFVCVQLETQFGSEHGFSRYDLFPFVLNDVLDDVRESKPLLSSQTSRVVYRSFATEVLETFNPDQANLSTWTTRLVKHHKELNAFLLERGVYLVSDWAILNDTTSKQLQRILTEFHYLAAMETQTATHILDSYHAIYRRDRLKQRQAGVKGKCLPPSPEQLQQMATLLAQTANWSIAPDKIMSQLQAIAKQLRQYRIYIRGGSATQNSLDDPAVQLKAQQLQVANALSDPDNEDEQTNFLAFYRQQFSSCLDHAIEQVTHQRYEHLQRKQDNKAERFLTALHLLHCQGQTMGQIAPSLGLQDQFQVTRLLKLKEFRANIRHTMLQLLRDRTVENAKRFAVPRQLKQLDQQIEAALDEQITVVIQEAEKEASIAPKNRTIPSLLTQRLCHHLDTRSHTP
jgi:hypothetical protein